MVSAIPENDLKRTRKQFFGFLKVNLLRQILTAKIQFMAT